MSKEYRHPLCKNLKVIPTKSEEPVWEDLVDRTPSKPEKTEEKVSGRDKAKKPAFPPVSTLRQLEQEKERQMSGYMTHELRAPLTSIRSALGILEMQMTNRLAPEEAQILKMAMRNADRLNGLINDIMDYTKVRAGKMTADADAVRPEDLMQEAVDSLRSWAVSKGIRITRVENDEPLPRVLADRRKTVQVLTNLLSNAIKFTPAGGKIEVSARMGAYEHAGTVSFRVKDTGLGVAHEDVEKIFKSFEQSAAGQKSAEGTGLGLTLAKAMIELQGGRIWAESWKGLGASFLFTLPIFQGDTTAPVRPYRKRVEYHGLLVGLLRRMNSVVAALFA